MSLDVRRLPDGARRVAEFALQHGCCISEAGKHLKITRDGMRTVFFSRTPSDHRAWRNGITKVRHALAAAGAPL